MALDSDKIRGSLRKLRKLLKKMRSVPSIRNVHRFRTNSRRIEAMLPALSLDSDRNSRRILKKLSKLRRQAGRVRDMDVLTGYAANLARPESEQECSTQLLEHLGAQRLKHAKKFHGLKQKHGEQLRRRLKQVSNQVDRILSKQNGNSANADTPPTVAASILKVSADLRSPARLGKANLHPYRLKVKELRNLLQMGENADEQEFVQFLGKVKDAIGQWHDWEELVSIAQEVLDHGSKCEILRELRRIAESHYRDALKLSETMRKRYLYAPSRKRPSRGAVPGPAEPVWSAASTLVA